MNTKRVVQVINNREEYILTSDDDGQTFYDYFERIKTLPDWAVNKARQHWKDEVTR